MMASYKEILKKAQERMLKADRGEQAALLYMLELTNMESHNLYMEYEAEMPQELIEEYEQGIDQLVEGKPLDHILGFTWFYGYRLKVNGDVLIPRPETEELVANILAAYDERFSKEKGAVLLDVGTGSGAIAIALKKEEPSLHILASDISQKAVMIANENAKANDAVVCFCVGDMLEPFIDRKIKADILISNPPYIPEDEEMEDSVVNYEPHVALFGGSDGLKFYRMIFENAPKVLNEKAMMAFEIGYQQKAALTALAKEFFPEAEIEVLKDINGKDRMLFIYFAI